MDSQNNEKKINFNSQFDLMVGKGVIIPLNDGRILYNSKFHDVMERFDRIIIGWAVEDGASLMFYPDYLSIDDLNKCNYIQQFHHQCFFAATSKTDEYKEESLYGSGFINAPAVCMHSYIQHQNTYVDEKKPIVITAKGKCKRNETEGYNTLERLLDFTMREIIFIGNEKYVLAKRKEYMDRAKLLMDEMQLESSIDISNDPFFKKEDEEKAAFQRKFKLKYELNIKNLDNGGKIAVGSFNYHGTNFSKAYNIKLQDNKLAHTVCIAFGLERFAYAHITQSGLES
ncbi:MAG: hypothetical protein FWG91_01410 [Lachnospiraceae bacterium]|nr:hypothetical protein [Lachnospiraceae bacterium]